MIAQEAPAEARAQLEMPLDLRPFPAPDELEELQEPQMAAPAQQAPAEVANPARPAPVAAPAAPSQGPGDVAEAPRELPDLFQGDCQRSPGRSAGTVRIIESGRQQL